MIGSSRIIEENLVRLKIHVDEIRWTNRLFPSLAMRRLITRRGDTCTIDEWPNSRAVSPPQSLHLKNESRARVAARTTAYQARVHPWLSVHAKDCRLSRRASPREA